MATFLSFPSVSEEGVDGRNQVGKLKIESFVIHDPARSIKRRADFVFSATLDIGLNPFAGQGGAGSGNRTRAFSLGS